MNRRSKRNIKKKAVPLYFQRSQSSSQFLVTAQYKHQIKKLKKVNKELACSLQEVKCRAADQERALSECNRESTQMMFVKMKVKDIVETVQKLVTDLGEVYDVIDGKSFDFLKNCSASHQEARIRIRNPSISTIEESASMSTIEPDLSKEESLSIESVTEPARNKLPAATPPFFDADSSQTEIYNVPLVLASEQKLRKASNGNQSAVTRSSKSLEKTSIVTRSSKSLERTGSFPLDQASPSTPQTPVFCPNFPSSVKSQYFEGISKLKPIISQASIESLRSADPPMQLITSQASIESQKSTDTPKLRLITSPSAKKIAPKVTVSKIPVKKPATSENNSPHIAAPSNHMNRRQTFFVEENVEEPHISLPVSDRRGTFVLDTFAGNAKLDIISDRRDTFVLDPPAYNAKSDIISDRRGTFVLNSLTNNDKPDPIFDRRTTYFIPTPAKEKPDSSPPKAIETHIPPVQNAAPNQTILLCEDMELTEIIPHQNQSHQFIPTVPHWLQKPETKESGLSEKLPASVRNQLSCTTAPVSNVNSSKQFEVSMTHAVVKGAQFQNIVSAKKDGDKPSTSNALSETKFPAKALTSNQDEDIVNSRQQSNKGKDVKKILNKEENANIKCSAKELPSPISHIAKTDLSIQHKIFQSISAINTVSEKNKNFLDNLTEINDRKKSTILKDSLSNNQPAADKLPEQDDAESPKTNRRSCRKQSTHFNKFFSDSDESDIDLEKDFIPKKRFSLKPGRKVINPNNKKVFVFKKTSTKQSTDKDILTDSYSDISPDGDSKDDLEKDVFNFSTSSEAGKSPFKKHKKRKSVMPKSNKRSVNRQTTVDNKILPKRKSSRNSKPEVNQAEVPVAAFPRKSILCLSKDTSSIPLTPALQSNRKSVRFTLVGGAPQGETNDPNCDLPLQSNGKSVKFTLVGDAPQGEINDPNCDSPHELNATPVNKNSNDAHDTEKESSQDSEGRRLSGRKKNSSARSNSLKATGDTLKGTSAKLKRSGKRRSCNLNLDSPEDVCESGCSPKKKMLQVSNEIPQKIETRTDLSCGKQEQNKDVKDRFEHSQGMSGTVSSEVLDEKPADAKKEKKSALILSELPLNLYANVKDTGSSDKIKAKRTFSGVSERRNSKKESIVDDLFLDLDNAVSQLDEKMETSFKVVEDEPIKEMTKSVATNCNKGNSVKTKTPKQKKDRGKKESSKKRKTGSEQSKDKENTPNNTENLKLDILTSDNNLYTLLGSKESTENLVKPKRSRKKKESAPLLQKDLKTDVLSTENPIVLVDAVSGRSRRNKPVMSFKEPSLHSKMRRE